MLKRLPALFCLLAFHLCAQTATQTDATGSVSGHVYCADTNQPARFATVLLQPPPHKLAPDEQPTASPTARTALDGSFHFHKVKPGTYYVLAEFTGYISPLAKVPPIEENVHANVEKLEKLLDKIYCRR